MDQIEKTIRENRELFDVSEPAEGHFDRFSDKLKSQPQKGGGIPWLTYLKAASIAILVLFSSLWVYETFMNKPGADKGISLGEISPEYREVEVYYTSMVNARYDEIDHCVFPEDSLQKEILKKELSDMDSIFVNLQIEFQVNPTDDRVIHAMIDHYEYKLEVMNQILDQLKQLNIQELKNDTNHEKANI